MFSFCSSFVAVVIFEQNASHCSWNSYDDFLPKSLGQLEYIRTSCDNCVKRSTDTKNTVLEINEKLATLSVSCDKLKQLDGLHDANDSIKKIIKEVAKDAELTKEDYFNKVNDKLTKQNATLEDLKEKINYLYERNEKEKEEVNWKLAQIEVREEEINRRNRTVLELEKRVKEKEIDVSGRERIAQEKLKEAKEKEDWSKGQLKFIKYETERIRKEAEDLEKKKEKLEDNRVVLSNIGEF